MAPTYRNFPQNFATASSEAVTVIANPKLQPATPRQRKKKLRLITLYLFLSRTNVPNSRHINVKMMFGIDRESSMALKVVQIVFM